MAYEPKNEQWKALNAILGKEYPATVVEAMKSLYKSRDRNVRRRAAAALGYYEQAFHHQEEVRDAVMPLARSLLADPDDQIARYALMALTNRESAAVASDARLIAARMRIAYDNRLIEMGATTLAGRQAWDLLYDDLRRTAADVACPGNESRARTRLVSLLTGIAPGLEKAPPIWGSTIAHLVSVSGVGRRAILCLKKMPGFDAGPVLQEEYRNAGTLESRVALTAALIVLKIDEDRAKKQLIEYALQAADRCANTQNPPDELKTINGWLAFAAANRSDIDLLRQGWNVYERLGLRAKSRLLEEMCDEFINNSDTMISFLCHDMRREELLDLLRQSNTLPEQIYATLLGYALREEDAKGDERVLLLIVRELGN
ncbi:MAG: hypothetical protein IMZ44_05485 [Planctomycetes bacterium]|nr:hypothetical protein [Planctomycetota bacterium]